MAQKKQSFEQSMQRLEQIVRAMEQGDVPLDEALKLFQEGTALVQSCGKLLEDAEMKVNQIVVGDDGAPVEVPFHEQ